MSMELSAGIPLWKAARTILGVRVEDFFRRWDRAVRTGGLDDIHDLRVSSRRMREGLLLFAPVYPPSIVRKAARRVKRVTTELGEQRNLDEALLFFSDLHGEIGPSCHGCLALFMEELRQRRETALEEMKSGLRHIDRHGLHLLLTSTVEFPCLLTSGADPFIAIAGFARQSMEERCAVVLALADTAAHDGETEAQHRLRIAVKHLRYRVEMLCFLFGAEYDELLASLRAYQDLLGTIHDLDVFAGMVTLRDLPEQDRQTVTAAIADRRERDFVSFLSMLETTPLVSICNAIRSAL